MAWPRRATTSDVALAHFQIGKVATTNLSSSHTLLTFVPCPLIRHQAKTTQMVELGKESITTLNLGLMVMTMAVMTMAVMLVGKRGSTADIVCTR